MYTKKTLKKALETFSCNTARENYGAYDAIMQAARDRLKEMPDDPELIVFRTYVYVTGEVHMHRPVAPAPLAELKVTFDPATRNASVEVL